MAQTPDVWGLRCPGGTAKATKPNLTRPAPSAHRRHSKSMSPPTPDFLSSSFVFIDILALFREFSISQARPTRKVAPPPAPPRPRRGAPRFPPWIRRGQGGLISEPFLCFHRHSRFVPSILQSRSREVEVLSSQQSPSELSLGPCVGPSLLPLDSSPL